MSVPETLLVFESVAQHPVKSGMREHDNADELQHRQKKKGSGKIDRNGHSFVMKKVVHKSSGSVSKSVANHAKIGRQK